MLLLLLLGASTVFSNILVDAIGGLVVIIVTAAVSGGIGRVRLGRSKKKEEGQSVLEKVNGVEALVTEMHVALVGADPTPLNPNPPPGIVDVVADVAKRTSRIEHTLFINGGKGNTVIDRLERIEGGSEAAKRVETKQTSLEHEREVRAEVRADGS